jgi:hypothetical protein
MEIISWNCKNGFDEDKFNSIFDKNTDILVIQECYYDDCIRLKSTYNYVSWYGDGKDSRLGIGLFSNIYNFKLSKEYNYNYPFRYAIPYDITGNNKEFNIFVVWTKDKLYSRINDKKIYDNYFSLSYVENIHCAIDFYKNIINNETIIIGDFNSNEKWDKEYDESRNHSYLIKRLKEFELENASGFYEKNTDQTYYYKYNGRKYSVIDDYCFVGKYFKIKNYEVGDKDKYLKYSDHRPIKIIFNE